MFMRKSIMSLLVAFVLAVSFTIPAASAGGMRDKLDSLREKIEERFSRDDAESVPKEEKKYALEQTIKGVIDKFAATMDETGVSGDEALDNLKQMITDEKGELDLSAVFGLLSIFGIGGNSDAADTEEEEISPYITALHNRDAITEAYLLKEHAEMIGEGDVPFISIFTVSNEEENIDTLLGRFTLIVYTLDGSDLKYKDSVSETAYFVYKMDDDQNFEISEAVTARDDETLNALCGRHGISREDFDRRTGEDDLAFFTTFDMVLFLDSHPEYERIEYNGKMYTREEMDSLNTKILEETILNAVA